MPGWALVGDLLGFIGSVCLAWPAYKLSAFLLTIKNVEEAGPRSLPTGKGTRAKRPRVRATNAHRGLLVRYGNICHVGIERTTCCSASVSPPWRSRFCHH